MAAAIGGRITSRGRTPEQNRAAGGVPNSRHLGGYAADLVPVGGWSRDPLKRGQQEIAIREAAARRGLKVLFHDAGSGWHAHMSEDGH